VTVEMSGVASVLARIAQIQASNPCLQPSRAAVPAPTRAAGGAGVSTTMATGVAVADRVSAPDFAATLAQVQNGQPDGTEVVGSAAKYLGVPYVFGGNTPAGLDCSGLVQRAYGDLGITLPRVAADQAHVGTPVPSLAQAQPGDILAFGEPAHHVALYLGNDRMIAAPEPGDRVKVQAVYETPTSIRRVVGSGPAGSTGLAGLTGIAGLAGIAGLNGLPGIAALTGMTGMTGLGMPAGLDPVGLDARVGQSPVGGVGQYAELFAQNEARYQLPHGLLAAVAHTESGGNSAAVSPAGAQGLMQLMPATAHGLGVDPWVPAQAVQGAARLLSNYLKNYGSVPLALAAYNAGPGAVAQYGGVPPYAETQNYVAKITALMAGKAG